MCNPSRSILINLLRNAGWLHRERIIAWALMLLITELLIVLVIAAWQHGFISHFDKPVSSDFLSFYAAGRLALAGKPALAYNHVAHYLAEQRLSRSGIPYQFFFYPPVFLLPCAALAIMPYPLAYVTFEAVTLAVFLLSMRAVLQAKGWRWIIPVLAFPATFWTIGLGQNAFLTAALFAGFTLLLDSRPISAGLLLSGLCYKPHFGLLAPVALLAAWRWRTFAAAIVGIAALVGLSACFFGWDTWEAFFRAFAGSAAVYDTGRIQFAGIVTPFGGMLLLGIRIWTAYIVQGVATVGAALIVAWVWHESENTSLRAATLLSGTLIAVPLALLYDQMLLLLAVGWLVRTAHNEGFLPWEKSLIAFCYLLVLSTWPVGSQLHIPLGPVESATLLLLALRRVRGEPRRSAAAEAPSDDRHASRS